jgi:hypothetical protein
MARYNENDYASLPVKAYYHIMITAFICRATNRASSGEPNGLACAVITARETGINPHAERAVSCVELNPFRLSLLWMR